MKKYELSKQKNIRDLGGMKTKDGHTIKYGRIFRGGSLASVSEEDIPILDSLHITDVVDLRGEDEFVYRPDFRLKGVNYHNFPALYEKVKEKDRNKDDGNLLWFVDDHMSGHDHLKNCYASFIKEPISLIAYTNFFKLLEEDNKVIYFHCSQGKDRVGFGAYLLEILLGVSQKDAIEDYLLSNVAMKERVGRLIKSVENKPYYNEKYHQNLLDVFAAKIEYIEESIKTMNELYGSAENFAREALHVDIERLKQLYLE